MRRAAYILAWTCALPLPSGARQLEHVHALTRRVGRHLEAAESVDDPAAALDALLDLLSPDASPELNKQEVREASAGT